MLRQFMQIEKSFTTQITDNVLLFCVNRLEVAVSGVFIVSRVLTSGPLALVLLDSHVHRIDVNSHLFISLKHFTAALTAWDSLLAVDSTDMCGQPVLEEELFTTTGNSADKRTVKTVRHSVTVEVLRVCAFVVTVGMSADKGLVYSEWSDFW